MEPRPYVGVTGPVSKEDVEAVIREFDVAGYSMSSPHVPMLGFVVTSRKPVEQRIYKGLKGLQALFGITDDAKDENAKLPAIVGKVLPVIHFDTDDSTYTLCAQVKDAFRRLYEGDLCRTVQLNMQWPDWGQVRRIKEDMPELQIVLRICKGAMPKKPADVSDIVRKVAEYGDSITYVSINPTGPELIFDINKVLMLYRELREKRPKLVLGFAGGFTGETVEERVRALIETSGTSDFCLNAERGLKDKPNGDGVLDLQKVKAYLQAAHRVLP